MNGSGGGGGGGGLGGVNGSDGHAMYGFGDGGAGSTEPLWFFDGVWYGPGSGGGGAGGVNSLFGGGFGGAGGNGGKFGGGGGGGGGGGTSVDGNGGRNSGKGGVGGLIIIYLGVGDFLMNSKPRRDPRARSRARADLRARRRRQGRRLRQLDAQAEPSGRRHRRHRRQHRDHASDRPVRGAAHRRSRRGRQRRSSNEAAYPGYARDLGARATARLGGHRLDRQPGRDPHLPRCNQRDLRPRAWFSIARPDRRHDLHRRAGDHVSRLDHARAHHHRRRSRRN